MHVFQPKATILGTSFKYDVGRPNVNKHILQTETVWTEPAIMYMVWMQCDEGCQTYLKLQKPSLGLWAIFKYDLNGL
jgi:hypothetical protein